MESEGSLMQKGAQGDMQSEVSYMRKPGAGSTGDDMSNGTYMGIGAVDNQSNNTYMGMGMGAESNGTYM